MGAQMSAQRIKIENTHADFVKTHLKQDDTMLETLIKPLLSLEKPQSAYTLGQIIRYVGGNEYPPRYAKRLHCLEKLEKGEEKKFTLGHCQIIVTGEKVTFTPEKDSATFGGKPLVTEPFTPIFYT